MQVNSFLRGAWKRRQAGNSQKETKMSQIKIINSTMAGGFQTAILFVAIFLTANLSPQAEEAEPPARPKWESSAALGLTLTRGNSDTLLFNANVQSQRLADPNEIRLGLDATYGETERVKSAESFRGFGQYNRLFSERFYGGLRLEGFRDAVADVEYRFTLSPMAGYYFIKQERTRLAGEIGPSFIYEKQGGESGGYIALRLGERFEHEFSERARIWQSLEFLPQVDDFDNFLILAEVGAEAGLTSNLSLRVTLQNWYDNQPAPGRKKNDIRLVTSLAYSF
jgi:putative salt-induced outer membrane protein YdiY